MVRAASIGTHMPEAIGCCSCPAGPGVIELNPEFEVTKISEYLDISNWVHHVPYILPQVGLVEFITYYCTTRGIGSAPPSHSGSDNMVELSAESGGRV